LQTYSYLTSFLEDLLTDFPLKSKDARKKNKAKKTCKLSSEREQPTAAGAGVKLGSKSSEKRIPKEK